MLPECGLGWVWISASVALRGWKESGDGNKYVRFRLVCSYSQLISSDKGPLLALTSLILIAGAILLIFLTLLGGAVDHNPTNRFYFLQADTSGIAGAGPLTRWTFWNACGVDNGRNSCPKVHPAYPLDPARNFDGPDDGIPQQFIEYDVHIPPHEGLLTVNSNRKRYYYLTRFMFPFVLIGLFFAVCSLFLGVLALCSRIGSFLSSALCSVALLFQSLTVSLMT